MVSRNRGKEVRLKLVLLVILAAAVSACSMQKSGNNLNSVQAQNKTKNDAATSADASQGKIPLKVDYLTPVSSINNAEIHVYKDKRRLYIVNFDTLVRDYPIGLGFSPRGDKEREGDGRTPEGDFFVCVKNSSSRFIKSLGLNYPDKRHAERAFFAGVINPNEFRDILLAFEKKSTPPWGTRLGGKIFIHAGGAHKDWTDGCIALYDSDMEELFRIAAVGTPVYVRP